MIWKLQKKTLLPAQLFGYIITLSVGITIALITITAYFDIQPILTSESNILNDNAVVISKKGSTLKRNRDPESAFFTRKELKDLKDQDFVKGVSKFTRAIGFDIFLSGEIVVAGERFDLPYNADLFFESVPDRFLDQEIQQEKDWQWEEGSNFIPIVMPESYWETYNLSFAPSRGFPYATKTAIKKLVRFEILLRGNNQSQKFKSRIVGFSSSVNSILVPESFLDWANKEVGDNSESKANKILVEFSDPNDDRIIEYLKSNKYNINEDKLERNKLIFFFRICFLFVFVIAIIIILLSIAFVLLSINLIFQKNKEVLINLYNIGYNSRKISAFYNLVISISTIMSIIISIILSKLIRSIYSEKLISYFDADMEDSVIFIFSNGIFMIALVLFLNLIIYRRIKKTINNLG